jgi:hypothetical protein
LVVRITTTIPRGNETPVMYINAAYFDEGRLREKLVATIDPESPPKLLKTTPVTILCAATSEDTPPATQERELRKLLPAILRRVRVRN